MRGYLETKESTERNPSGLCWEAIRHWIKAKKGGKKGVEEGKSRKEDKIW